MARTEIEAKIAVIPLVFPPGAGSRQVSHGRHYRTGPGFDHRYADQDDALAVAEAHSWRLCEGVEVTTNRGPTRWISSGLVRGRIGIAGARAAVAAVYCRGPDGSVWIDLHTITAID